ncbi:MAG: sulfotransferase [Xanthomonadales bacterium]|jgi:tetratricopeptide (TPR) repeat protein|nr:sulfotransferase [Xanthomonadales bacterium]
MTERLQDRLREGQALFDQGRVDDAIVVFESCLPAAANNPHLALNLGHAYSAAGNIGAAVQSYQVLLDSGEPGMVYAACWSLADLKGYRFEPGETARMTELAQAPGPHPQRFLLMFALGRALEQAGRYKEAMSALHEGNEQVARERPFPGDAWRQLASSLRSLDRVPRADSPLDGPRPVFIVGMPRSGSTLVEQILGAHSRVQATSELPFIENMARTLDRQGGFARVLPRLTPAQCRQAALAYLGQVTPLLAGKPDFFTDKWPNNFWYVGLIRALFPGARIVNVLRDPLDNAMAVYKQYFSHGNEHSFRLQWVAEYWEVYLAVMAHWEALFPGETLHFSYTRLVEDPATAIRRLLDYCGLEFEQRVLRFHQVKRSVMTPSGQQVRQPIYQSALGSAAPYRPFMGEWLERFEGITGRMQKMVKAASERDQLQKAPGRG